MCVNRDDLREDQRRSVHQICKSKHDSNDSRKAPPLSGTAEKQGTLTARIPLSSPHLRPSSQAPGKNSIVLFQNVNTAMLPLPTNTADSHARMRQQSLSPVLSRLPSDRRRCHCHDQRHNTMAGHQPASVPGLDLPPTQPDHASNANRTSIPPSSTSSTTHSRGGSGPLKSPTGTGPEPLNILILGASFGGLSVAHAFLDDTVSRLRTTTAAPNYRLVVVSPSTCIYWNIGAPRALVAPGLIKQDEMFQPIEPGFHRHRGSNYVFVQGEAKSWDPERRTVEVECGSRAAEKRLGTLLRGKGSGGKVQTVPYHALILATGSSAHSDLLSLHGPHESTIGTLNTMHARLATAKSIIVCGGGCSGIETAGQLATYLNYTRHWPYKIKTKEPKTIILLTGSSRCLPELKPSVGAKAEKALKTLGVDVRHNVRVSAARTDFDLTGQTKLELDDDTSMIVDAYIPCTGVAPNSSYAPASLKDERGYIINNPFTMRIDAAGPRVFALGDVASYSFNYVLDVYAAVPIVMHNLLNDLLAHEMKLASPYGGNDADIEGLVDAEYVQHKGDSYLCPISRYGGVGVLMGTSIPELVVHGLKG